MGDSLPDLGKFPGLSNTLKDEEIKIRLYDYAGGYGTRVASAEDIAWYQNGGYKEIDHKLAYYASIGERAREAWITRFGSPPS
jgi:hypothetical protein